MSWRRAGYPSASRLPLHLPEINDEHVCKTPHRHSPDSSVSEVEDGAVKDEYLTLSTIHSAKGLEWKVVFIIGAVDGRFPSVYSFNSEEELDEELRLMYVAATRAKSYLYITYPIDMFDHATGMVLSKPSRFLDDIDSEILEKWSLELEE